MKFQDTLAFGGGPSRPVLEFLHFIARDTGFMTNEDALQLVRGDRVAFHDEGIQARIVTKVEKLPNGTVIVYAPGDLVQAAEAKDVH